MYYTITQSSNHRSRDNIHSPTNSALHPHRINKFCPFYTNRSTLCHCHFFAQFCTPFQKLRKFWRLLKIPLNFSTSKILQMPNFLRKTNKFKEFLLFDKLGVA